ncbi:Probable outer membrane component of multidrug efflux pump [hydrothermal vent metagenome]|uniref:Probable outer membrane component of multidrug efflux pump n=1 Tax=hydrothermal vent metagenome TaxID=652676 RepID=A0A1W1D423_9ZZZZ
MSGMKQLSKIAVGMLIVSYANAASLKDILNSVAKNNELLQSSTLMTQSKNKDLESVSNIYAPNIMVGDGFSRLDGDVSNKQVGTTNVAYIKAGITLYDGGKNKAIKKQKLYQYKSNFYQKEESTKELLLQTVTLFFQAKSIEAKLFAYEDKSKTLKAQYEKEQIKFNNGMTTIDSILKLKSEYQSNLYVISDLKYQLEKMLQTLTLLSNKKIKKLDESRLKDIQNVTFQDSFNVKSLQNDIEASKQNINIIKSAKKVQVRLEDSYSLYYYDDYNKRILSDLPDQQNKFLFNIQFNLYDTVTKHKKESLSLVHQALNEKLMYQKKQDTLNFALAKKRLETEKEKITSSKLALEMAQSVYDIVSDKYENGIVDNITYLDALSKKVINEAIYKEALYEYEIAKANYYFYSGINYQEMLK